MVRKRHAPASDLHGLSRLTIDAIAGVVDVVEAMHSTIASVPGFFGSPKPGRTTGITGLVYRTIGGTIGLVGHLLDRLLATLNPLLGARSAWRGREAALAALNGVLGDYLAASKNPLAIGMCVRRNGHPLLLESRALATAIPRAGGKVLVLVHGLCMNDLQWKRRGHDHGAALAGDLGYTSVYVHYNTGLHISVNGRALSDLLGVLVKRWPVPVRELVIVGHSMGGLVARSACHYGAASRRVWLRHLDKLVFLGTPHHGAPLERGGNVVDMLLGSSRYTAPLARLGKIRSAGITDLRYGNLVHQDWEGRDRFERSGDARTAVPLPAGVKCFTIAASTATRTGGRATRLIGDGIVPLASALGRHQDPGRTLTFPESRRWIGYGMNHLDLLSRPDVYGRISRWLAPAAS
jgi:pimeloyl-ACP methyl ester carboxylesterase